MFAIGCLVPLVLLAIGAVAGQRRLREWHRAA
jgi:hypothetical protein